ncbi:MAG: Gfo/Idh/MocA family protein [Mycobacterium sp.]
MGVVGAGLIAQVMHLHYLRELGDQFETAALCDIVLANADAVAQRFSIPVIHSDWRELLDTPIDAVLILSSGDHAPIATAAAQRGLHVLVEKPMSYSVADGQRMVGVAAASGTTLMVGYQKRYDPAYLRFKEQMARVADPRLLKITTLESPYWPYVEHYSTVKPLAPPEDVLAQLRRENQAALVRAIGPATDFERQIFEGVVLASLVHELNALRGLLGEPDVLEHASLRPGSLSLTFRFGDLPVTIDRIDLPGIARYRMDFALYGPNRRMMLSFPSPFLRSEPTLILNEEGEPGTTMSRLSEEIVSYESPFKRELIAFHDAITRGTTPATVGADAVRDICLCQAIMEVHRTGRPIEQPSLPR